MTMPTVPVRRLWLAVLFGYLALGATLEELPTYLTEHFDADPLSVGLTVGAAFGGAALGRPFAGRAGDAGRSRAVASGGAGLTALAAIGHLVAPDLATLLVARVAMGLGEAALFSGVLPWVLSAIDTSRAGRVAGWFGLSMWGGLSVGPLLAVVEPGSTAVWTLVIVLPLVSSALLISTPPTGGEPRPTQPLRWRTLVPAGVARPGGMLALASYGYGTLTALLVLFLASPGLGGQGFGLAVFSGAFLLTRAGGSPFVDRVGGRRVARAVLVVEAAGLGLLALADTPTVALVAAALTGVGLGVIYPATSKLVLRAVPAATAGAAMGTMTSFWDLGILVAGPTSGLVATHSTYRSAFALAAAVVLAAFALAALPERIGTGAPSRGRPAPDRGPGSNRSVDSGPGGRWTA